METQKKIILIFSTNPEEAENPIAVFDDPQLATEFLARPLATGQRYEITEHPLNPIFSTTVSPVWFVSVSPGKIRADRIVKTNTFCEEQDALNGYAKKEDGMLFLCLFANSKDEAEKLALQRLAELCATGEWDNM